MSLLGTEIKSIRAGNVNINDAYCFMKRGELWLKNAYIKEYEQGNINNHDPYRERKLLLTNQELSKISRKIRNAGVTIVPLRLFINKSGLAKLEIAVAKGKKLHDKRESLKEKDIKREIDRRLKS